MKRFCQTLELRNDPELIDKYCEAHAHVWPEIQAGIRDFVADNARLATLPRQAEWEAYVAQFQGCDPAAPSTAKWRLMEKIFELEK